jgi:hypothetical protein
MCAQGAFWPENAPQVHIARPGGRLPYYFDATGGGPSNALSSILWGSLLLGLLLLGTAVVFGARDESRPRI